MAKKIQEDHKPMGFLIFVVSDSIFNLIHNLCPQIQMTLYNNYCFTEL